MGCCDFAPFLASCSGVQVRQTAGQIAARASAPPGFDRADAEELAGRCVLVLVVRDAFSHIVDLQQRIPGQVVVRQNDVHQVDAVAVDDPALPIIRGEAVLSAAQMSLPCSRCSGWNRTPRRPMSFDSGGSGHPETAACRRNRNVLDVHPIMPAPFAESYREPSPIRDRRIISQAETV